MTAKRKEHPQKALSREWLVHSLLDLMKFKPYKEITISDLTSHADLSRRTFYRHFKTLDDVLDYTLQAISSQFVSFFLKQDLNTGLYNTILIYFTYWEQHKNFLIILKENNLLYLLLDKFLPEARAQIRSQLLQPSDNKNMEYVFYFTSGGAWNLLVKWLDDGAVLSPLEMADISKDILHYLLEK